METCKKCGTIIAFVGGSCPKCAKENATPNTPGASGSPSPFGAFGAFGMFGANPSSANTNNDNSNNNSDNSNNNSNNNGVTPFGAATAATLNKNSLLRDLKEYRELLSETAELKSRIKPQSEFPKSNEEMYKRRSFIKYFWPFVVAAPVSGYLIYIISYLIMMSSVRSQAGMYSDVDDARRAVAGIMGDLIGGIAVAIIVAAAIIIFGIIICKRKQLDFNSNADYMNRMVSERYQMGVENQKMIDLYQDDITRMRKFETMVPKDYQNYTAIGKIIDLIEEDRATTIEGACDIIKLESL